MLKFKIMRLITLIAKKNIIDFITTIRFKTFTLMYKIKQTNRIMVSNSTNKNTHNIFDDCVMWMDIQLYNVQPKLYQRICCNHKVSNFTRSSIWTDIQTDNQNYRVTSLLYKNTKDYVGIIFYIGGHTDRPPKL